jgi:hypothetical protein
LRFYPDTLSQEYIANAIGVRARSAELLFCDIDVEEVSFNQGYYTVDLRFFYKINGDAYSFLNHSDPISGLAVFDKRVILYGGAGSAKLFSSQVTLGSPDAQYIPELNLPIAVCESVDPVVLNIKIVDSCDCASCCDCELGELPAVISDAFPKGISISSCEPQRKVYVTLGQFSIIRLERDTQILIPLYDYCLPEKECVGTGSDEDPCELFSRIDFPVDQFFPPNAATAASVLQ